MMTEIPKQLLLNVATTLRCPCKMLHTKITYEAITSVSLSSATNTCPLSSYFELAIVVVLQRPFNYLNPKRMAISLRWAG